MICINATRLQISTARVISTLLAIIFLLNTAAPTAALAQKTENNIKRPVQKPINSKRAPKKATRFAPTLSFSGKPTDAEITKARIFDEPLLPVSAKEGRTQIEETSENGSLTKALLAFRGKTNSDDTTDIENFIRTNPDSPWTPSLQLNLGIHKFETGYLSQAMDLWRAAWNSTKHEKGSNAQAIAERAIAELVRLEARLGQVESLESHLSEIKARRFQGSNELKVESARSGLACMKETPEKAFKCGPFAIDSILNKTRTAPTRSPEVEKFPSTRKGTNLAQIKALADKAGLKLQFARRSAGAPFVVPSILHWRVGHFAAITGAHGGKYEIKDPTFDSDGTGRISARALEAETDGYFLIPEGPLPAGWTTFSSKEAETVWGKGVASDVNHNQQNPNSPKPNDPFPPGDCPPGQCCPGMATISAWSLTAAPNIVDVPLTYSPPVGPTMDFRLNYNYLEVNQPGTFTFTNFGPCWTLKWLAYLTLDASSNATVSVPGGGAEAYAYQAVGDHYPKRDLLSNAKLVEIGTNSYERQLPDGSVEIYDLADGTGRIFMTECRDPQGNSVTIQYDVDYRVTGITDAIGQQSTVSYVSNSSGNPGFYKVASITDPFSRTATFAYDSTVTNLVSITDVVGITSKFAYDTTSSFINLVTTPYGTTAMNRYTSARQTKGTRFVFADGSQSAIEYTLQDWHTYFWNRHAMQMYPFEAGSGDNYYSHSSKWEWLRDATTNVLQAVPRIHTPLGRGPIEYTYPGQSSYYIGTTGNPITISRNFATWSYAYNALGHVTQEVDPLGRKFTYTYDSNDIDLLSKKQTRSTNNDFLGQWQNYNSDHLPLKYIDGSGRETNYTYNSAGQVLTVTDANSNVTAMTYDGDGYLTQINGPLSGNNDITTFTYDSKGRLETVTDSEGYTITYSYDDLNRLVRTTYPDSTFEETVYERLSAVFMRDRLGRITQRTFNSLNEMTAEIDPLGRKTEYVWCTCGSLSSMTDAANNTTGWHHDLGGNLTQKVYPDSTTINYTYNNRGLVQTRTDALNQLTTYGYNADDTLAYIVYSNEINDTSDITYSYDPDYKRVSTIQNGWGTITYAYNPYITTSTGTTTGAGRIATISNNAIANSQISYSYDVLGRVTNRSINGSANSIDWAYDAISRVTTEDNELGQFTYSYVDNTPGSSKGVSRLAQIDYPNGQVTKYTWYGNNQDQRLKEISNLTGGSNPLGLSRFMYAYDPAGQITSWIQQQKDAKQHGALEYDRAGQLISAKAGFGTKPPPYASQNYYDYDAAANRTAVQRDATQRAAIAGTVTPGDVLTITAYDSSIGGGQQAVNYTVQSGDTLSTIASKLAALISANGNLQPAGISATANGAIITLRSVSANPTTYTSSTSGGATETISLGVNESRQNITIGGTVTTSNVLTIRVRDASLSGGEDDVTYTVQSGDTLSDIATALATGIDALGADFTATAHGPVITVQASTPNVTNYSNISTSVTETIEISTVIGGNTRLLIGGSKTTSDVIGVTFRDAGLPGGEEVVNYTVQSGDTLATIASGLASAIASNADLTAIGVNASATGTIVSIVSSSANATTFVPSRSTGATETVIMGLPQNGTLPLSIAGTKTTGDVLTVTVHDAGLPGGSKVVNYTVLSGDSINSIGTNLAAAITVDVDLAAAGISATAVNPSSTVSVVNLLSTSVYATSYVTSLSGGATETMALAPTAGVVQATFNNVNQLTALSGGGAVRFQGTTNRPVKPVTINSGATFMPDTQNFRGNPVLSTGNSSVAVSATSGGNTTTTNNYQTLVNGAASASFTYDANGNMTSDGTNTYAWDAENRLIRITYPGTNNRSEFTYDALGRNVKIVEVTAGSTTSTKQFVWCGDDRCEERDGSAALTKQFVSVRRVAKPCLISVLCLRNRSEARDPIIGQQRIEIVIRLFRQNGNNVTQISPRLHIVPAASGY